MKQTSILLIVLCVVITMVIPGPIHAQGDGDTETRTIAELLAARANDEEAPEYNTLLTLIQRANSSVFEAIADPNANYTLFAPTDAAFEALSRRINLNVFNQITSDSMLLTGVLLYHLVPQTYDADQLTTLADEQGLYTLPTSFGQYLDLTRNEEGALTVDGLNFQITPLVATNGVIYQLDFVLLPEVGTLADVLDTYLEDQDSDAFDTLYLSVLQSIELDVADSLNDLEIQWTIFAPTEVALNAIVLDGTFSDLLDDSSRMTNAFQYTVLPARYGSFELMAAIEAAGGTLELETLQGAPLTFTLADDGAIRINDTATIIDFDIDAVNGTIHVIDAALLPPQ